MLRLKILKFFQEEKNLIANLLNMIMNNIRDQCQGEKNLTNLCLADKKIILVHLHPIIQLWEKKNSINQFSAGKNTILQFLLLFILLQERNNSTNLYLVDRNTTLLQITQCLDHSNSTQVHFSHLLHLDPMEISMIIRI